MRKYAPSDPDRLRGRDSIDGQLPANGHPLHSDYPRFEMRSRPDNSIRTGTFLRVMLVLAVLGSAGYDACQNLSKAKSMQPESSKVMDK